MGTITRNFANSITATSTLDAGVNFKNLLINGDMTVYQPAVTKTSITADENQAGADRYNLRINVRNTWAGTLANEPTFVPTNQGFKKALYIQTTTAETSVSVDEIVRIGQKIEANLLPHLKYGTANAQPLTFSFWVRSSLTGTFVSELWHRDHPSDTGFNSQSFTISSADTWEKKTVTFQGDTVNGFNYDTGIGLECNIWLGAGTNYTSGGSTTGGVWSTDVTKRAFGTSNDFINTLNANFYTTGWQLEIGETATDFEFVPQDITLTRCKRYYQRISRPTHGGNTVLTGINSQINNLAMVNLPVAMRAAPSISQTGTNITLYSPDGASNASASNPTLSAGSFGTQGGRFLWTRTGNIYAGFWVDLDNDDSYYNFNAEI